MKKIILFVVMLIVSTIMFSQIETLELVCQTRMSASSCVEWDSINNKIIVGAGAIVKIYDASDINDIYLVSQRPLKGYINELSLYGDTLFVAATHDGVYALDYLSEELDVFDWYDMHDEGVKGAYDLFVYDDTIYVADNIQVRILTYDNGTFTYQSTFGPLNSIAVARRNNIISVGNRGLFGGTISLYDAQNLSTPMATWQNQNIWFLMDVDFADLNDSIVYVCGGPRDITNTSSVFYALYYDNENLVKADSLFIGGGIPGYAQVNIMNMTSKNDTLFLATTAANNFPTSLFTIIPILDATGLPDENMIDLGYINAGLWHFDGAVMKGTDYMAIASEWLGVIVTDISKLNPLDTLSFHTTGGWTNNNFVIGDTLYTSQEGDGMYVYSVDSLMLTQSFMNNSILAHWENGGFISTALYLNDSLLLMSTGDIWNVLPWKQGGEAVLIEETGRSYVEMELIETDLGDRIVGTWSTIDSTFIDLYNPHDPLENYNVISRDTMNNDIWALEAVGDTVYYGKEFNSSIYLVAAKVENDQFELIDSIYFGEEIYSIDVEDGKIAVGTQQSITEIGWNGNTLQENNSFFDVNFVVRDIDLKNGYYYVADKFYGAQVVDMSAGVVAAKFVGSEGWLNLFGSTSISVRDDGLIFLSDFHAGTFIIEKFDETISSLGDEKPDKLEKKFFIYPNPADQFVSIYPDDSFCGKMDFNVYDINGRLITRFKKRDCDAFNINTSMYKDGIYFYSFLAPDDNTYTGKFLVKH